MATLVRFVVRFALFLAALVFAASLAVSFVLLAAFWSMRSVWARIAGRPQVRFVTPVRPRSEHAIAPRRRWPAADVTDVEARPPGA